MLGQQASERDAFSRNVRLLQEQNAALRREGVRLSRLKHGLVSRVMGAWAGRRLERVVRAWREQVCTSRAAVT